jgi:hypothetical protein
LQIKPLFLLHLKRPKCIKPIKAIYISKLHRRVRIDRRALFLHAIVSL